MPSGLLLGLLALAAGSPDAWARPTVHLDAVVEVEGGRVVGRWTVVDLPDPEDGWYADDPRWSVIDPLAGLPHPEHELDAQRTWPAAPSTGRVRIQGLAVEPGGRAADFETTLPVRWGDTGVSDHGVFANGAWYPQLLHQGDLPLLDWVVHVRADDPEAVVVVGDAVGRGAATWTGRGERAALAVLPHGVVTPVRRDGADVTLVTGGRPGRAVLRALETQLDVAAADGRRWHGAVVVAPLRRRLVRTGPGLAYLSDRAWRVFPWFRRLHHEAVVRGLLTAWWPDPDPLHREVAASAWSHRHVARLARAQAVDLVGLTRWLPLVDSALYDREMAFLAEVFHRPHPTDRVRDDLVERFAPHGPGAAFVAQVGDRHGERAVEALAEALIVGEPWSVALGRAGLPVDALAPWRLPYPEVQDYRVAVDGREVVVSRQAPTDALEEAVVLSVDGARQVVSVGPGPARVRLTLDEAPDRVVLDPDRHLAQRDRVGDAQPSRLRWTLQGQITGINFTQLFLSAFAAATFRRADDTQNLWSVAAFTNQRDRLLGRVGYRRSFGAVVRGTRRLHGVSLSAEASWLNPNFTGLPGATYTLGGGLGYSFDNRESTIFPTRGGTVAVSIDGGGAPESGETWTRLQAEGTGLVSVHPRHVLATRLAAGVALTDLPARRLRFGGASGVRGVPDDVVQTRSQAILSLQYRAAPGRGLRIPLGVTRVVEIQAGAGVDVGVGLADEELVAAISPNANVGAIFENLGIAPGSAHVVIGVPAWVDGFQLPERRVPLELYVGWAQAF